MSDRVIMQMNATTTLSKLDRNKTIGIIGGGQLGRMLAMSAGRLGFYTVVLEPTPACPAAQFTNAQIVCDYEDEVGLKELAQHCFCVTYEFENVPVSTARVLENLCTVAPGSTALETSQDRLVEKRFFNKIGIETAPYETVEDAKQLEALLNCEFAAGALLKTRRLGYDGKGQMRLAKGSDFSNPALAELLTQDCILEGLVNFDCEISVVAARNTSGEVAAFDSALNVHENGILASSTVPSGLSRQVEQKARDITASVLNELAYVGVIAIEFFVCGEELLVNEFAPRVHNSGHWTEAACPVSQFEQHIRAITGLALAPTTRHSNCEMFNLLGDSINNMETLATLPNVHFHHYGKKEAKTGRKMGHYTKISPIS